MKRACLGVLLLVIVISSGCIGGSSDIDWDLEVYGSVNNPQVISYNQLEEMEQMEIEKQLVNGTESYSGASLDSIFAMAGLQEDVKYVSLIASDGYILTFDIEEVRPTGILALYKEGERLDEKSGPVMLAVGIGCVCNWMKKVKYIELLTEHDSFGILGDVTNAMRVSIRDIRDFTGKEDSFTAKDLFDKAAYYTQSQTFLIHHSEGVLSLPIGQAADVIISYDGTFSATVGSITYASVSAIESVWDPMSD